VIYILHRLSSYRQIIACIVIARVIAARVLFSTYCVVLYRGGDGGGDGSDSGDCHVGYRLAR
jgi:hypothetical protein